MQTEPIRSNDDRAERALRAIDGYDPCRRAPDTETDIIDLAVDLLHLADRTPGLSAERVHFESVMHYNAEKWDDE